MMMTRFRVLSPIQSDRRYEPGDEITEAALVNPARYLDSGIIEPMSASPDDRSTRIQAGIAALPKGDDHWTAAGLPDVRALRSATGLDDISAAERDREWRVAQGAADGE